VELAEARKILDIEDEFSPRQLKSAFRRSSSIKHPDVGGSQEDFIALMQAFELLKPLAGATGDDVAELVTVEGTPLADLGKGYPITTSAKTCEGCGGRGYKSFRETKREWGDCPHCGGSGLVRYPCKHCEGTGQYKHPKTKKVVGECRRCKGSGWFYPYNRRPTTRFSFFAPRRRYVPGTDKEGIPCRPCNGSGRGLQEREGEKPYYTVCTRCEGVGEVKMKNPVLPRGFLAGGLQK